MFKIRNLYLYILFPFLLIILHLLLSLKIKIDKSINNQTQLSKKAPVIQNIVREKITYDVIFSNLYLGKSYFSNIANIKVNGRLLNLMTVETKLTQFTDNEKIYSDPQTLLPVKVERDIYGWFIRERITEDYNQEDFILTIIKKRGAKEEKIVIRKDGFIHNAVLLPYFVRKIPNLDVGKIITANLPNCKFEIKLVSLEEIKVPAGTFKAYHFISTPKQFEIWISADEHKIPLKIRNIGTPFGYSMVMREYK